MASSTQRAESDGTLVLLDLSIDYLDRSEITVFYDLVPNTTDWSWVGLTEKRIAFSPAVPDGVEVLVRRSTDITKLRHEFSEGAAFTADSLDEDLKQVLHITQEASEANLSGEFYSNIDLHGYKIVNSAPGVLPTDVPNLGQLSSFTIAAAASADEAEEFAELAANNARLNIGTVTSTISGGDAEANISGPAGSQYLNLILPKGDPGDGFPAGGDVGQVLMKQSAFDFDTAWILVDKTTLGLGNVDNTGDSSKPISAAQAAGLVGKTGPVGAAVIPSGTTVERPGSPAVGHFRYNTTTGDYERYTLTGWRSVGQGAVAHCRFNGTLTGTNVPASAKGITSVTRNSLGLYTINFASSFAAGQQFPRWTYAKGKKLNGLVTRRNTEKRYWDAGCPVWPQSDEISTHTIALRRENDPVLRG